MRFDERMRGIVMARVSPDEKRTFIEAAPRQGLTLSEFLRETASEAARRVG